MSLNNGYKGLVPQLKEGLYRFKSEVTPEVELEKYEETDKGKLSSVENRTISGEMVKRAVED